MKKTLLFIVALSTFSLASAQCWQTVSAGRIHAGGIKSNGTLWMWGWNNDGQLGDGTNLYKYSPTQIGFENNWKTLAVGENTEIALGTGGNHTIAIKTNGTLWAWGLNTYGQLGDSSIASSNTPIQIGTDTNWKDVSVGPHHTLALKNDGTMWAWGNNQYGQLGINSTIDTIVPTQIGTDTDWDKIATGSQHCLAIKTNGTMWSWGRNNYYQLGFFNDNTNKLVPTQINTDTDWETITVGEDYSFATKTNHTIWGWGRNDEGRLGLGTNTGYHPIPEQIGSQSDWIYVDAGNSHTIAIKSDSSVWGWGYNYDGELAQGNNTFMITSPVEFSTLSNTTFISTGGYSGMSINNNGELKTWGYNDGGVLGTGNNNSYNTPQLVDCPAPFVLPIYTSGTNTNFSLVHEVFDYTWEDIISISGDTIAKTQAYNNVYYKEQFSSQFEHVGFLRQDSTNTKAWYKSIADTSEYLIMDLNLNIGDTFVVKFFSTPTNAIVTGIDTLNGRKRVILDYAYGGGLINEYLTFIEGIGPNASFFYQSDDYYTPIDYQFGFLPCSKKVNGTTVFQYFPDTADCFNNSTNVLPIKENNFAFTVYPNPVSETLIITASNSQQIDKIILSDLTGKIVLTPKYNTNKVDLSNLNQGIYLLQLFSEGKSHFIKVIKQ